jgi:HSP20 family protein
MQQQHKPLWKKAPAQSIETNNPFASFDRVFDSISRRAFELFDQNGHNFGHELDDWLKAEAEYLHPAFLRVSESDNSVTIEAEVPGFEPKDLDIRVEGKQITICGRKETSAKETKGKTIYEEQRSNRVCRVVVLPAEVEAAKAHATLKNGILEVQVPKSGAAKSTKVEIKVA